MKRFKDDKLKMMFLLNVGLDAVDMMTMTQAIHLADNNIEDCPSFNAEGVVYPSVIHPNHDRISKIDKKVNQMPSCTTLDEMMAQIIPLCQKLNNKCIEGNFYYYYEMTPRLGTDWENTLNLNLKGGALYQDKYFEPPQEGPCK